MAVMAILPMMTVIMLAEIIIMAIIPIRTIMTIIVIMTLMEIGGLSLLYSLSVLVLYIHVALPPDWKPFSSVYLFCFASMYKESTPSGLEASLFCVAFLF